MPQSAQVPSGVVTGLHGRAQIIPSGEKTARALKEGDMIRPGDKVLTDKGTVLRVTDENGVDWMPRDTQLASSPAPTGAKNHANGHANVHANGHVSGGKAAAAAAAAKHAHADDKNLDEVISAVNRGDEDAAAAAGLGGGGGGAMGLGLRVDRVIETVTPQEFQYSTPDRTGGDPFGIGTPAATDAANRAPVIEEPGNQNYDPSTGRYTLKTEEDKPLSGQVKATDPDGDPLSYVKGSDPLHGTVVVHADGTWTYTPNKDYNGSDSFTVTVSDGKGGTATATVDIGITPVNDAPKIEDPDNPNFDPVTGHYNVITEEDMPVSGHVKATDVDAGDVVSYAKGSDPEHGKVEVNADGSWTYTPDQDYNGPDQFTVTVSDGHGGTTTATVDIGVVPMNDAPQIVDLGSGNFDPITGNYVYDTHEDTPVSGQVKAIDVDEGDVLTYVKGSDPAHGQLVVNADGTWTYTPEKDYNGADSFTVTVHDGHGGTATTTVEIGVKPVNDAPKFEDVDSGNFDPITGHYVHETDEDTPVSGQVKASDVDGDALSYAKGAAPAHGDVVVNADGTWTYTPGKDFNGSDSFTVTVSDGQGGTATTTVEIGVRPVNDAPKVEDLDSGNFDPITGHYVHETNEDTPVSGQVKASDVDGDALTYTKGSDPEHGAVIVHADGTWTYTPSHDFTGADSFTVTVSDGQGGTATAVVDIGVNPANDGPKIDDPDNGNFDPNTGHYSLTTEEDKPLNGQVKASDADGDALSFAKGSDPAHGSVIVNADGTWTYTPAKDFNGSDSFTVTVSDGHGGTATATIDIGVTPVNDGPKLDDPSNTNFDPSTGHYNLTTEEDKPLNGQVKASDADGDTLSFAKGSDPAHGSATVNADGTWTYTPAKDFNGSDSFTVTVSDGHGGTATATIDIGVMPVNDGPKLDDPSNANFDPSTGHYNLTTEEDKPLNGQVKASDADGDALSFAKGSDPAHGTVTVNADGTWTYTPAKDFNGSDSFTVTVSDGHGGTTTATIDIGVTPVNDGPKLDDPSNANFDPSTGHYSLTTEEDKPLNGQVKASDADGDALSFAKGSDPAHGSATVNADGTWTYTPAKDFNGSDSFTVTVSDGHGGTATATIDIGVMPVNDGPKLDDPSNANFDPSTGHYSLTTEEDKPLNGQVKASDADGDALSFAKGSDPAHGSATVNADGTWTYTPAKDFNGSDSFTVTVSDGHGGTATATIDIGVMPVNDGPKLDDPSNANFDPSTGHYNLTTEEDKPLNGQVKASDADGDTLSFAKGSDPAHGTVTVNADGTWTYTPAKDFNGSDSFTVTVSDGHGGTATATIDIGVMPVNDGPKLDDPSNENFDPNTGHYSLSTEEDKPLNGQVRASDADGDALSFAKGSDPAHGTVTVNADGTWTYTPAKDFNGSDSFTVTVSDGHGGTATATIDIGVTPVNDGPKIDDPSNANFDPSTGHYTLTTDEEKPVSGQVKATDADGDALSFVKGSDPAHGSVTVNADGTWTYTPAKDFNGSDSFTVTVSDGHGGTATATIDIGVTPVNDGPKIDDPGNLDPNTGHYTLTTEEDKPVSGQVKASDADGDTLSFAKGSDPTHGTVTVNADGTWTYTPAKDFNGSDSFTVTVSDGHGGTATATIDIGVTPVNDGPKIDDPSNANFDPSTGHYTLTTDEEKPVSGQVKATDADGDALSFVKGSDPAHGSVTVNADGTWTYTPAKDFNGSDSFTVTVSDGHGGTATATIDIGVTPVNDGPKLDDPSNANFDPSTGHYTLTTEEDKPLNGQVKASDTDGDALSFSKGSGPAHGSVTVNADGTWTYTPTKDFNGSDSFTVTVSDGHGGTATATIDIGVAPVNDAPRIDDPNSPEYDPIPNEYFVNTDEDKPVSGQVKATDSDGDTLSFAKGSDPAHGTVTVNADGTWTYTPAKDFSGSDSFTVTVSDGHGGMATTTVNIGVNPINDAPRIDDPGNPNLNPATGHYTVSTDEDKPVSGQVKATDADGDALSFAKGSNPAHGAVTVNPDGTWTYTPAKDFNGSDSFTISVSDGHGGTTTATIDIGVKAINDAPVITAPAAPAPLSEEGLASGNADSQGAPDTGNSRETSGQITVSDADGDKLSFTLAGAPGVLTSGGVAVTWSGNGTAGNPLVGSAGGKPVLTATIDDLGHYKITLQGPVDHPNTTVEDSRSISLAVQASDGSTTSTSLLSFQVEDDSPVSGNQVMRLDGSTGTQNTNLMLIVDTSGSMKDTLADKTANGIKAAINSLIDRYDGLGDVKIQIVTFGDAAQGRAAWLTVAQAKTFVDALTANGGTNYDAALAAAKTAFATAGKLSDGVNVSYFITDGQPSSGKGLDTGADETNWETFLKANSIDSYAVGTGSLTAQYIANIEPVAYDGIKGVEQAAVTLKTNTELGKYLLDTVPTLKGGSLAGLAGADGLQKVEAFSSSKQVSSVLDATTKVMTITLQSGSEIKLNTVTGDFTMKQAKGAGDESFSYTIVDKDGDRASGTLTLGSPVVADANHAPVAMAGDSGANILGLVDLSVNPLLDLSKTQHVAVNDVDNNLVRVDISVGQFLSLGTLLGDSSKLSLSLDTSLTHGLHITGNDSRHLVIESDTPGHTIDVAQVNHLLSTLSYAPAQVLGVVSVDLFPQLTIKATDAYGLTDAKSISSSLLAVDVDVHSAMALPSALASTVENIVSGSGDHHGTSGTDVFAWTLADKAPLGSHHVDTISDFNCASRSAGGDVLDLRDLLQVDHAGTTGTSGSGASASVDKLLNFLDFDTQSQPGSTIIHVSASGGFQTDGQGHTDSSHCSDKQEIVLANVDLRSSLGLDHSANDQQIISELMNRGKLLVDHNG